MPVLVFTPGTVKAGKKVPGKAAVKEIDISDFCCTARSCTAPAYLQPHAEGHPLIDACILPDTLVLYTISDSKERPDEAVLEKHLECLPDRDMYYLDYVVPSDVFPNFKVPELRRDPAAHPRVNKVGRHQADCCITKLLMGGSAVQACLDCAQQRCLACMCL
jgi:hypothetical protein